MGCTCRLVILGLLVLLGLVVYACVGCWVVDCGFWLGFGEEVLFVLFAEWVCLPFVWWLFTVFGGCV